MARSDRIQHSHRAGDRRILRSLIDHMIDTLTTPVAVIAGTILTASMMGDISPFLMWSLAIIAGGGVSALMQGGTVALRPPLPAPPEA